MKVALLPGNRFSAWHFRPFAQLGPDIAPVVFRVDTEIQQRFDARGAADVPLPVENLPLDTQTGAMRWWHAIAEKRLNREPRLVPFAERLKDFHTIITWELFTPWTAEALEAKRRYGVRVLVVVWDNIVFNNEDTPEKRATKARALREADGFVVPTAQSYEMLLLEGAPRDKVHLIAPGVDTEMFRPAARSHAANEFVVLFVGWLLPRKGIDFLLLALRHALNYLQQAGNAQRIRLVIVGEGPGEERVRALVTGLGLERHCTIVPATPYDRMPEVYQSADLFVLPSIATETWQEQFGMAMIEAMSCGVPVITTYSGALPEVAGEAGLLCAPNDFLSLSRAIVKLQAQDSLHISLGERGRQRAVECYDLKDHVAAWREVLGRG